MPTAAHQRSGFHDQILCNRSLEKPTLTVNFLAKNLQEIGNCSRLYMQKSHCMPMTHRSFYLISSSKQPHVGEMIIFILVDEEIKPWMLTGRGKIYFQASVSCPKIPIPPACFKPQLFGIFPKRISTPEDHISSYLPNVFLHMDLGPFFFFLLEIHFKRELHITTVKWKLGWLTISTQTLGKINTIKAEQSLLDATGVCPELESQLFLLGI